jgi:putative endonuclease
VTARAPGALEKKAAARERGARAELEVARFLRARGAHIVATNLRVGRFELDIVARHGNVVLVVEVRTRKPNGWTRGLGTINEQKRRRIRCAAERLWRDRYAADVTVERLRFDAASVRFEGNASVIEYVTAAF